jgi:predicted nucleic acid-binding protein
MRLLDSNILIYAAKPEFKHLKELLKEDGIAVSEMSRLEVLGYKENTNEQRAFFNAVFSLVNIIPIDRSIIDVAINLRQSKNMKVGDAIIAATALLHCNELITRNTSDFKHIIELTVINPIDQ